jgi:glycerol-3-phosphate dehydrogenase (NAD(P)+)
MVLDPRGLPVAVVGAGAFGTALATVLVDSGCVVDLWVWEEDVCRSITEERENTAYLPGVVLPAEVRPKQNLAEVVAGKRLIVAATPSHVMRDVFGHARPFIDKRAYVVCASKGIEAETLATVDVMLAETLPQLPRSHVMVLSGPSFAAEVARRHPTAVSLAGPDETLAREAQGVLMQPWFRVYTTPDVPGVALGGSIKNVLAIAAGASDGLGFGHNTRAAIITRGLRELTRLAVARGASPMTLAGLSGMGDLVLTCTGELSRNRSLGFALGRGEKLPDLLSGRRTVAEGVRTTRSVMQLAEREGIDAPISREVHAILYEDKPVKEAMHDLMHRPPRSEHEFSA